MVAYRRRAAKGRDRARRHLRCRYASIQLLAQSISARRERILTTISSAKQDPPAIALWLDPVCPFSWNTARWLASAVDPAGQAFDVRMMSLAILNEGRDLPAPQQARINDSRRVGRLMVAVSEEIGPQALPAAYFAFAELYFDRSMQVDHRLAERVLHAVGAERTTAAALDETSLDGAVAKSHQGSQNALGDTAGSPLLSIDGRTVFGPVLTSVPDPVKGLGLLDAVSALVGAPEFSELSRPREHP